MAALTPCTFLSTLSLRRATIHGVDFRNAFMHFYPRSPCGERPSATGFSMQHKRHFYPRSPCGERLKNAITAAPQQEFLSTLSLRRATSRADCPRTGRQISIHALLAESDPTTKQPPMTGPQFLSTLSLRRATSWGGFSECIYAFLSTLSLRRATAKVHKTVGHFCAYETNFMEIASSC